MLRSVQKSKDEQTVYPVIAGMAIGNPQYRCTQDQALVVASKCPGVESIKPVLERVYGNSRIGSRYFAVPDFTPAQAAKGDPMFFPADGSYEVCMHGYVGFAVAGCTREDFFVPCFFLSRWESDLRACDALCVSCCWSWRWSWVFFVEAPAAEAR